MRNERGITLVSLIITIIIMLILSGTIIYTGAQNYEYSKITSFITYMQALQKKVDLIIESNEDYMQLGQALNSEQKILLDQILNVERYEFQMNNTSDDSIRYFDKQAISKDFEMDNIDDDIVVNFKTREIISLNGIEYDGNIVYTQYNLPGGQKIIVSTPEERILQTESLNIQKQIDGLNAVISITVDENYGIGNGTLSYKYEDENWNIITNTTRQRKKLYNKYFRIRDLYNKVKG